MYSNGELGTDVDDKICATVLPSRRFPQDSDGEDNIVCDRNGNVDRSDDDDRGCDTDPLMMLGCKSVSPANHKMVQTGDCHELIPAVRHNGVVDVGDINTTRNVLWGNAIHRQDRKLLSDGNAVCKKMCANICGRILDLQDDSEVTTWTVLPLQQNDDVITPEAHCEFQTCRKINTEHSNVSANFNIVAHHHTNISSKTFLPGEDLSELETLSGPHTTACISHASTLVMNSTHNSNISSTPPREPSLKPTSNNRFTPKGIAASKSTLLADEHCSRAGYEGTAVVCVGSVSNDSGRPAEGSVNSHVKKTDGDGLHSCGGPCGTKTIHKSRHAGRKTRTKSKSMGEAVELKLKVSRRHEPCQLVSCTPLASDASSLMSAPLLGSKTNTDGKVAAHNVAVDIEDPLASEAALDRCHQRDSQVFTPVKTHSKRSLAKTTSVCLDDSVAPSPHQHVRRYGYDYDSEPIHMTLEEVKTSLQRLYGQKGLVVPDAGVAITSSSSPTSSSTPCSDNHTCYLKSVSKTPPKKSGGTFHIHLRPKKGKDGLTDAESKERLQNRKSFPSSIKQTFCSLFGTAKKSAAVLAVATDDDDDDNELPVTVSNRVHSKSSEELSSRNEDDAVSPNLLNTPSRSIPSLSPFVNRALPPLPLTQNGEKSSEDPPADLEGNTVAVEDWDQVEEESLDFTASIQQVKDYGWYWGPISGELAEKILANEPDGSFIVRDSSDEHYIFSLTFKLNGLVRHVRIEHDQGNFSFGTFTNFKSQTIVGFIESAVKHSRSGRYLFFLHRRPVLGPMRVQLLHPVSRFKQVQSLQHMCRFVILKAVRRDLIYSLPLPKRLKDYLNTPQYYTEDVDGASDDDRATSCTHPAVTPEQNLLHGAMPNGDR